MEDIRIIEEEKFEGEKQENDILQEIREESLTCPSCFAINKKSAKYCGKCVSEIK